jgi:hypothetical protein
MNQKFQRLAQEILNKRHNSGLTVDGIFGPLSAQAAQRAMPPATGFMTPHRWAALVIQREANQSPDIPHRVAEDGWFGPVTEDAAYRLLGEKFARPDESHDVTSTPAPPVRCWSPTDRQMIQKYGNPGSGQVLTPLPFPVRLDWDLAISTSRASMHRLAVTPITAALETIRDHYGLDRIRTLNIDRFGGILNVRRKRGGTTWSAHAWGTAIDLWPAGNKLAWKRDRAAFARPEYEPMRNAFRAAGLMSLGECYNFDWMHWQLNP